MQKFFFLFLAFILVSCNGVAVQRLVPVSDETPDDGVAENDSHEVQDSDTAEPTENIPDDAENPTVDDNEPTEQADEDHAVLPDAEPADDDPPDDDIENPIPDEEPDEEPPVCGEIFNGSNCFRASCETDADCCEADLCVTADACGGAKVCRSAFFKENFDSYIAGSFPTEGPWTLKYYGAGNNYQIVTSEKSVSPENSMHLLGNKMKNFSAIMAADLPQVPDVINVELKMNAEGDDVAFALCSFAHADNKTNWGDMYLKVEFADGKIRYQIPEWTVYDVAPSYEPNHWYKLRVKMNQSAKTVSVWVDDELKVSNQAFNLDSWSLDNICLASNKNYKKVWFDDIFIWAE